MKTVEWNDASWLNAPLDVVRDGDDLVVTAAKESDFWRYTSYGFVHDSGHALLSDLAPGEAVEVSFVASMSQLYDQAGLLVRVDERTWLKAGVEWSDDAPQLSVVATRDLSDWSMRTVPDWAGKIVTVRASLAADAVTVRARCDGPWSLERVAPLPATGPVRCGPMLCAPTRAGLEVRFTRFVRDIADSGLHDTPP
jgi:regulation of enolase protein 1 (concanavalin A-like superfamily)